MANKAKKEFELPSRIAEIHFGFLSGKHYIGTTDIGKCTALEIKFDGNWHIKAEFADDNDCVTVAEKSYSSSFDWLGLTEISDMERGEKVETVT